MNKFLIESEDEIYTIKHGKLHKLGKVSKKLGDEFYLKHGFDDLKELTSDLIKEIPETKFNLKLFIGFI